MRKVVAILFLVLYAGTNIGLAARLDFCGEKLNDISFYSQETQVSDCCMETEGIDDNCCSAEIIVLQESSDKIQKSTDNRYVAIGAIILHTLFTPPSTGTPKATAQYPVQINQKGVQPRLHLVNACFLI